MNTISNKKQHIMIQPRKETVMCINFGAPQTLLCIVFTSITELHRRTIFVCLLYCQINMKLAVFSAQRKGWFCLTSCMLSRSRPFGCLFSVFVSPVIAA